MRIFRHLPLIGCLIFVPNVLCVDPCENGVVTDSLIMMNYSEDDCLQSNSKHCYKSLDNSSGLCYLGKEERTTHPSKDCVYHLPIVYESEQIVLSDEYVSRALSGPITTLNGSFPDNAFQYCESINCYMVVHEETTNSTYFMANPSQLSLQESGITFGPSDKRYTFYFEPRCEPMEPQARLDAVGDETACDYGKATLASMYLSDSPDDCINNGLCYQDFGTPDFPAPQCYLARETPPEPIDIGDGQSITVDLDWPNALVHRPGISGYFPVLIESATTYASCLKACLEQSCFALMFDEAQPEDRCRLAQDPFTFETFGGDQVHISFFRQQKGFEPLPVEDLCREFDEPPVNAVFEIGYDLSDLAGPTDRDSCRTECEGSATCYRYAFRVDENECRFWNPSPDLPSTDNPICIIQSSKGAAYAKDLERVTSGSVINADVVFEFSSEAGCWEACASNPRCKAMALELSKCYMLPFGGDEATIQTGFNGRPQYLAVGKIYGDETACDYGKATAGSMALVSKPDQCIGHGLCYQDFGTPDFPAPQCYLASEMPPEPIDIGDGKSITVELDWPKALVDQQALSPIFPAVLESATTYALCLKACLQHSCFALMFDEAAPERRCRLAKDPFKFDHPGQDEVHMSFFRRKGFEPLPVEELCQDQSKPPLNLEFGSAYYDEYREITASSYEECLEKCSGDLDECPFRVIYRPQDETCVIFDASEVFVQDSGSDPSTPPDKHSGQQCVVRPALQGRIRPNYSYKEEEPPGVQYAEPRERHYFQDDSQFSSFGRNHCWEYCSQIPWCQAVLIPSGQRTTCYVYDRAENLTTIVNDSLNWSLKYFAMIGKRFTDENFCDNGGIFRRESIGFFPFVPPGFCHYFELCSRTSALGPTFCHVGRETKPPPLIVKGCEMQPFIAPLNTVDFPKFALDNFFLTKLPNTPSYEACVQKCSWKKLCLGMAFVPSTQECYLFDYVPTTTTTRANFSEALTRNVNRDEEEVGVLMAFDIPDCPPCVRRVLMQEQISFKDEIQCTLTSQESCSDVYKTIFKTQEVEECKESFVKNCHIEYEMVPRTEKVEMCHSPLTRDCNEEGPETCTTEFETVCDTTYHENEVTDDVASCTTVKEDVCDSEGENCRMVPRQVCQVDTVSSKKLTPEMDCRQEAREVCGPEICPIVQGERICVDELKTFVQEVPQEKCQISPKTVCDKVHKIVPKLEMNQECIDVPQEICQTVQVEANKENIPIVKEWCPPAEGDSAEGGSVVEDVSGEANSTSSSEESSASLLRTPSLLEELAITKRGSRGSRGHGPTDIGQ